MIYVGYIARLNLWLVSSGLSVGDQSTTILKMVTVSKRDALTWKDFERIGEAFVGNPSIEEYVRLRREYPGVNRAGFVGGHFV